MIPSSRKVGKDFFQVLTSKGRSYTSPSFKAKVFLDGSAKPAKFSITVAKKLEKSAVKRNFLKRRAYALLRPFLETAKPGSYTALFIQKGFSAKSPLFLKEEIESFLRKAAVIS